MKNWIKAIFVLLLLVLSMPTALAAAESGRAVLTAENNQVSVALNLPEGKTETITSLRLTLRVSVETGAMKEPTFQFENALSSLVKDADIKKEENGSYLVDLILSGKKDQDIFGGSESVKLGTLSILPEGGEYQVKTEVAVQDEEEGSVVKYMDANGMDEMTVSLADTAATVLKSGLGSADSDRNKIPVLKTTAKSGTRNIIFEWDKIESADGYILYEYNSKSKSDEVLKTINGASVTAYSQKFAYASKHTFRLRAFWQTADGSLTYGAYSSYVNVTLSPAKVKGFSVKKKSTGVTLSWKKVAGADGYQIYFAKKKNGKYKLLKTIKKAKTKKFVVKKPKAGKIYYKVRAYVNGNNGKKKYGVYSAIKS